MFKYETIIFWSDEDQAYLAEAPELPGCMAHGETYESALANAKDAIQLWLDIAEEFGDVIPEPKGRRLMYLTINHISACRLRRPGLDTGRRSW